MMSLLMTQPEKNMKTVSTVNLSFVRGGLRGVVIGFDTLNNREFYVRTVENVLSGMDTRLYF